MAAPVFGAIGTQLQVNPGSTTSVAVPAGVAANDIIVVVMFVDGTGTVSAMPSGFAHAAGSPMTVVGGGGHSQVVAWKRATGADVGTYDFTIASAGYVNAAASRYTGCITTGDPWDPTPDAQASTALSTVTPAVTVTTSGSDRLLVWSATNWSGGAWTPPTGFTERRDSGDQVVTSADLAQAVAGSSGSITGSCVGNDRRTAFLGALLPASAVTSTATPQPLVASHPLPAPVPVRPVLLRTAAAPPPTLSPYVVAAPGRAPAPSPAIVSRGALDTTPPLATATPQPLVVSGPAGAGRPVAITVRSTLADPPVLTTASPLVVTVPTPPPPSAAILLRTPAAGAAVPPASTPAPMVVTAPVPVPPATALIARGSLADPPVLTTASPYVVAVPPPATRPSPPVLARGSLADLLAATEPLVVTRPAPAGRGAAILFRAPAPPAVVGPSGPSTAPMVVTAPGRSVGGTALLLRTVVDVCDCITHRPSTGVTTRPSTGTTTRPSTGITVRPCSCS